MSSNPSKNTRPKTNHSVFDTPNIAIKQIQDKLPQNAVRNLEPPSKFIPPPPQLHISSRTNKANLLNNDICNKCGRKWHLFENSLTGHSFYGCSGWPKCKNSREKQLLEKFCGNGHRRTVSNTAYTDDGARRCLICRPYAKDLENFCSNGHPRTQSNTAYTASGARRCLVCQPFPEKDLKNFCANGHLRTPSNTSLTSNGERRCLTCRPFPERSLQKNFIDLDSYCRNGHLRTQESTYVRPSGERECSICRRNRRK